METLFLQEKDVMAVLDFDAAIDAVEEGFRQYGMGLVQSPPWREVCFAGKGIPFGEAPGIIQAMGYLERDRVAVIKHFYRFPGSTRTAKLRLIDAEAGKTLALMEANYESWMRTGAAGAVGAKYFARESCSRIGIIGTGKQARGQTRFLARVRPFIKLYAYSTSPLPKREEFAREMERELEVDVKLVASAQEAVENADVLVTATQSTKPIIEGDWIKRGLHITCMGADDPLKVELAESALMKADKLVIDYEKALETAQLRIPLSAGNLKADDIYGSIGEIVAGKKPGRENDDEITIFHSTGMTAQDVPLALAIYKKAREKGIGHELRVTTRMLEESI
jgi:alanine dehydrogenase